MKSVGFSKLINKTLEISSKDIYINRQGNFSLEKENKFNVIKFLQNEDR